MVAERRRDMGGRSFPRAQGAPLQTALLAGVLAGVLAGLLGAFVTPAAAQEGRPFTLFGRVVDGVTGGPVSYARVRIAELERTVLADSLGHFHVRDLPAGTYTFETRRIGYRDHREPSPVRDGNVLFVALEPLAVELEGLDVVAPRAALKASLDARLAALGSPGTVREEEDLRADAAPNLRELISEGSRQYFYPCINESKTCLVVRGRRREIKFYVDDLVQPEGAAVLEIYDPSELYRVEVLGELGQIRIYTRAYATWMAATGEEPRPICVAC